MKKHTPGPWQVSLNEIETVSGNLNVATVTYERDGQVRANSALIAAAPMMLAALEALFENCAMVHKYWGDGDNTKQSDEAITFARAAIAKATE
jgi:hypothetical protein